MSDLSEPNLRYAAELAYGMLWHLASDRNNPRGRKISDARIVLGNALGVEGKAKGIEAAREFSQKNWPDGMPLLDRELWGL